MLTFPIKTSENSLCKRKLFQKAIKEAIINIRIKHNHILILLYLIRYMQH